MKRIIGILTLSCLLFSACGKDEIPQEENEKKTEETRKKANEFLEKTIQSEVIKKIINFEEFLQKD